MKIYLVGGAVRDKLLGRPIIERDWVVVGATEREMLALGYQKVGRDFPVFLHPKTREEYALARTERKTGKGYTDFICDANPTITLEDDLKRRDLTINAIAEDKDGKIIDPYGGVADLKNKILRHVSSAFGEDPVRVLRVARFAAKFGEFTVHDTTQKLMQGILRAGELDALVEERVWNEFSRALAEPNPEKFFLELEACGALEKLFPAIQKKLELITSLLQCAVKFTDDTVVRFAVLMGNLSLDEIADFCRRYRPPRAFSNLAKIIAKYQDFYRDILQKNHEDILFLIKALDALRQTKRWQKFLISCEIMVHGVDEKRRKGVCDEKDLYASPRMKFLNEAYEVVKHVDIKPLLTEGLSGEQLKEKIVAMQLVQLQNFLRVCKLSYK